jgi:pSer/pThr/pTyr-binding forkhead associated (FHA) protein
MDGAERMRVNSSFSLLCAQLSFRPSHPAGIVDGGPANTMHRRSALRRSVLVFGCLCLVSATPVARPQSKTGVDLVIVLDQSGSMRTSDPQRLTGAAVGRLLDGLGPEDAVGLVFFGTGAAVVQPLAPLVSEQKEVIRATVGESRYSDQYTNIAKGVERGQYELRERGRQGATKALVFLTDGVMDTGDASKDEDLKRSMREVGLPDLAAREIQVYGIAFTEQADYQLIQEMAVKTGGQYYRALRASELGTVFEDITKRVHQPSSSGPALSTKSDPGPSWSWYLLVGLGILAVTMTAGALWRRVVSRRAVPKQVPAFVRDVAPTVVEMSPRIETVLEVGASPRASLRESATGRLIPLEEGITRIGRGSKNQVTIDESTISESHAQIECRAGSFLLRDLRSANGTFLNGSRVNGESPLRASDKLRFDTFEYEFIAPTRAVPGTVVREHEPATLKGATKEASPATMTASAPTPGDVFPSMRTSTETVFAERMGGSLTCPSHPHSPATYRCSRCRQHGCAECIVVRDGKPLCSACSD